MRYRILTVFLLLSCLSSVPAADWPNWRGPDHNGISTESGWQATWTASGPKQLWKVKVGTGFASVAVSDGHVFTLGNEDDTETVFCLDAKTGEPAWSFDYKEKLAPKYYEGGPSATPTVDGQRVFTFSKSGAVRCFEASTGKVIWKQDLAEALDLKAPTWGFAGSPLVQGDRLVLNAGDSGVALNKETGAILWSSGEGPGGYSTPVPFRSAGKSCVALMGKEELLVVQVEDGSVQWRFPWKTRHHVNAADPIVLDGNRFFIASGYGHGCALVQVKDGAPSALWENKNMRSQMSGGVFWQGHVYGIDDKQLSCLDIETGDSQWTEKSVGKGSLMMADGKLIALSDKGELSVAEASPSGFDVLSRAQVLGGKCWTPPVLSHGRIYCRNAEGDLVCLDMGQP